MKSTLHISAEMGSALDTLLLRLAGSAINWAITGSLGFRLQGIEVDVHDIDVQTDQEGAYKIEHLFQDYSSRAVHLSIAEQIKSHFGALNIEGVQVEIMGDIQKRLGDGSWEKPVNLSLHKTSIHYRGIEVPVLSLEYEYEAYTRLGRFEKAKLLKDRLREKRACS